MPTPIYRLMLVHPVGFQVEAFRPMTLPEAVTTAAGLVDGMEGYQTVYRQIRRTGGLYSSAFLSQKYGGPMSVLIVDAALIAYPDARDPISLKQ